MHESLQSNKAAHKVTHSEILLDFSGFVTIHAVQNTRSMCYPVKIQCYSNNQSVTTRVAQFGL